MFTANALTWDRFTEHGHVLPITASLRPPYSRPGRLSIIGTTGPQMQESISKGVTLARQTMMEKNMMDLFRKCDIAITIQDYPDFMYDGPSAGLATYAAVIGVLCGWESNPAIAMTGEILPDGTVYKVRAVNRKVATAVEQGIHTVFMPAANEYKSVGHDVVVIGVTNVAQIHELGEVEYNEEEEEDEDGNRGHSRSMS